MKKLIPAVLLFVVAACASDSALRDGRRLIDQGKMDEGIQRLEQASKARPDDEELRVNYQRYRDLYFDQLMFEGEKARALGRSDQAAAAFQRAQGLKPGDERAASGVEATRTAQERQAKVRDAQALLEAGKTQEALNLVREVLREDPAHRGAKALQRRMEEAQLKSQPSGPRLKGSSDKRISLQFRDVPLKSVFDFLSQVSGINFVFDREVVPDTRTTILLRDTPLEEALGVLLVTNQLEKKVINDNTVLVYPNTPERARDYQPLVVRSFYLSNADVKQTLNLVKTVLKTQDVFIDERLNLLVMRDTPETIRMAERLIAAQDLAEPEVILEVKVMEVSRTKLRNLGAQYPTQVSAGVRGAAGIAGEVTLSEWLNRRSDVVVLNVTDPAFILNLQHQDSDTNLLANPRVRVRSREKAKIHIGDRLPVITTTSTANVGISESVQYLDVGLKLDIEPNVYLEDEVAIKIGLEVSNIVQEIRSEQGTLSYRIGTRNTATVLRVGNGETQVLAGLIQDEDRRTTDKVPALGNLPLLGSLFRNNNDSRTKTEIVLLFTPYIVRTLDRPSPAALQIASEIQPAGASARQRIGANGVPDAAAPAPGTPVALALSAPAQARAGEEFTVTISAPAAVVEPLQFLLEYDSSRLQVLGEEGVPGQLQMAMSGSAMVRFRPLPGRTGPARIAISKIAGTGERPAPGQYLAPPPAQVTVTQ